MFGIDKEKAQVSYDIEQTLEYSDDKQPPKDFHAKLDKDKYGETKRGLKGRHLNLMIIGQTIGTGLFIGLGLPLYTLGSLSLLLGFIVWLTFGVMPLIFAAATFSLYLPIPGCFLHLGARIVDPAFGFAVNYIYTYTCMMFVALEATGVASVIQFWTDINPAVFIAITIVVWFLVNIFGVRYYGEIEGAAAFLKIVLICGLMMFGLVAMCGGNPNNEVLGFKRWNQGGLFREFLATGSTGRFLGWWNVLIYAAFACGGPDQIALLGGEMENPRKQLPLAARATYFRICLFYFGGIFFMNSICAANDPVLVAAKENGSSGVLLSPWVIGIQSLGVKGLALVVNAGVLTLAFSCGNGFLYGATRSLYGASLAGYAPRFFSKCLKNGTPIYALIMSLAIGCLAFLSCSDGTNVVFNWFINLSTTGMLCTYLLLWIIYFKFKKAVAVQGTPLDSPEYPYYRGPRWLHDYVAYFSCGFCVVVLFFNGFWVFFPSKFTVLDLFALYFAPVFWIVLYVAWKILKRTKIRSPEEADLTTGKQEFDEYENEFLAKQEEKRKPGFMGFLQRLME